jgi:GNAT superfamily N-acetyltransferase
MELQFMELTKEMLKPSYVVDINNLLPQLSSSARPCTDEWLNCMFDSGTRLFVALDDDKIVGTVLLCTMVILVGRKDWIEDVVVDENYRRRNIATILMEMAHQASRERGAKSINLTSKPDRGGARKMYGDMGYEVRDTGVFRLTF